MRCGLHPESRFCRASSLQNQEGFRLHRFRTTTAYYFYLEATALEPSSRDQVKILPARQWAAWLTYGVNKHRTREDKKEVVRRRHAEYDRSRIRNDVNPRQARTSYDRLSFKGQTDADDGISEQRVWRVEVVNG
jgi:hypothetical protein